MKTVSANELALATNVVLWFVGHTYEMGTDNLARLIGVSEREVRAWAMRGQLLWESGESLDIQALPLAWAFFAGQSRASQALHEAFCALKRRAKKGSQFYEWAEGCRREKLISGPAIGRDPLTA